MTLIKYQLSFTKNCPNCCFFDMNRKHANHAILTTPFKFIRKAREMKEMLSIPSAMNDIHVDVLSNRNWKFNICSNPSFDIIFASFWKHSKNLIRGKIVVIRFDCLFDSIYRTMLLLLLSLSLFFFLSSSRGCQWILYSNETDSGSGYLVVSYFLFYMHQWTILLAIKHYMDGHTGHFHIHKQHTKCLFYINYGEIVLFFKRFCARCSLFVGQCYNNCVSVLGHYNFIILYHSIRPFNFFYQHFNYAFRLFDLSYALPHGHLKRPAFNGH